MIDRAVALNRGRTDATSYGWLPEQSVKPAVGREPHGFVERRLYSVNEHRLSHQMIIDLDYPGNAFGGHLDRLPFRF